MNENNFTCAVSGTPGRGESYSGLVNRQLPTKLCMSLVWLPFIMKYAILAK